MNTLFIFNILAVHFLALGFLSAPGMCLDFAVKDKTTNEYCLLLRANVTGSVQYLNLKNETVSISFRVPEDPGQTTKYPMASSCGKMSEKLVFDFFPDIDGVHISDSEANLLWLISLQFVLPANATSPDRYVLRNYSLTTFMYTELNSTILNNSLPVVYKKPADVKPEWSAAANWAEKTSNGFTCSSNQLPLLNSSSLTFQGLKVLAFAQQPKPAFNEAQVFETCQLDVRTSDLVPIIVGACLTGLVIVVLVAYLIGRARARRQGYASV